MKSGTTKTSNKDDLRSRFAAALKDIDEKTQLINGKKAVVKETFDNLVKLAREYVEAAAESAEEAKATVKAKTEVAKAKAKAVKATVEQVKKDVEEGARCQGSRKEAGCR